jgi:hypothetical protein
VISVRGVVLGFLVISAIPALCSATEFLLDGRFGGTVAVSSPHLTISDDQGTINGSRFVGLEGHGPFSVGILRPVVSFYHHWTGFEDEFSLTTTSNVFGLGASGTTRLGMAGVVLQASLVYIQDTYHLAPPDEEPLDVEENSWGVSLGADLQFAFFEDVDAIAGYRYLGRSGGTYQGETASGSTFQLSESGGEHCISAGLCVRLGGV